MIRAFLGIALPREVRARLAALQALLPLPRAVDPEDFHLTLVFLGEVPDAVLEGVDDGLRMLSMPPFALTLAGAGLFGGGAPRTAWAGVEPSADIVRLQAKVGRIARQAGARIEARRFVPHVTLGRFAPPAPEDRARLERAVVAQAGFRAGPVAVREVTLWRSHPGGEAPRYEVLADWPLG